MADLFEFAGGSFGMLRHPPDQTTNDQIIIPLLQICHLSSLICHADESLPSPPARNVRFGLTGESHANCETIRKIITTIKMSKKRSIDETVLFS